MPDNLVLDTEHEVQDYKVSIKFNYLQFIAKKYLLFYEIFISYSGRVHGNI